MVSPLLKKPSLDLTILDSFCPISKLLILVEKVVAQLLQRMEMALVMFLDNLWNGWKGFLFHLTSWWLLMPSTIASFWMGQKAEGRQPGVVLVCFLSLTLIPLGGCWGREILPLASTVWVPLGLMLPPLLFNIHMRPHPHHGVRYHLYPWQIKWCYRCLILEPGDCAGLDGEYRLHLNHVEFWDLPRLTVPAQGASGGHGQEGHC